jgi:hypothetical protein
MAMPLFAQFKVSVTSDTLKSRCGTDHVKLVFIAMDSLWYVDFSESNPKPRTIHGISGVPCTPALSPDGNYIAYVTGVGSPPPLSSTAPNSTAWLCSIAGAPAPRKIADIGWSPRFDLAAATPTVIYATCGKKTPGMDTLWKGCGKMCEWIDGSQPTDIWTGGSLFGGMSFNGRWICTADNGPAYLLDKTSAANTPVMVHRLRWVNNKTKTDTLAPLQACNPSISSSRLFFDAMMYLDVGTGDMAHSYHSANLGAWGMHSRIFISRSSNSIAGYYDMPADPPLVDNAENPGDVVIKSWESPRWSNHPYFASAALFVERSFGEKTTDRNESVYMINLKDSSYLKLLSLTDTTETNTLSMEFPWLWVETPQGFDTLEDRQWLNRSMDAVLWHPSDNSAKATGYRIVLMQGKIFSTGPMISVEFYSLNGKSIGKLLPELKRSCSIPRDLFSSGLLFGVCAFSNGKQSVFKVAALK